MSARLEETLANKNPPPPSCSLGTTPDIDDEEVYLNALEEETGYYNTLVNEGGRPSHPLSLGRDILTNPGEYREIFTFWQKADDEWTVFEPQMRDWQGFRKFQREVRQENHFPTYCQQLQDRLARHEFTRSFYLEEELNRQNNLATWVEFLNYKYQHYEKATKYLERQQEQHDKAWKKVVDSKILSFDTEERVWDRYWWLPLEHEYYEAKDNMRLALATVDLAEKSLQQVQGVHAKDSLQLEQELSAAKNKLAVTTEIFEPHKRRLEILNEFWHGRRRYKRTRDRAGRLVIQLRWMLQQVSLIELELNPIQVNEEYPTRGTDGCESRPKRKRADECSEEPGPNQQRQDGESHTLPESKISTSTTRETTSIRRPRQTRSSRANHDTLQLETRSSRSLRASRASKIKAESKKTGVVLDDGTRVRKRGRPRELKLGGTSDSQVLRRSSRRRRPPERFQ